MMFLARMTALLSLVFLSLPANAQTGNAVFQLDSIITIRVYFPYPDWKDTLAANYESEREVPCTFIAMGDTLEGVGVRYKGNSSYGVAAGTKKSFKFDFDEFVSGQRFDQLEVVNLNNSYKDPTLMREVLMYGFLSDQGIDAPRAAYANLYVNEDYRGLYVSVEEPDEDEFLHWHFGNAGGNLYKADPYGPLQWLGSDTALYRAQYEKHTNEEEDDWSDLLHFIDRLNNVPLSELPDSIETLLDIPDLMRFFAINTLFVNLDSYQGGATNYYLYHRPDGRFQMIPWDVNEAFGNCSAGLTAGALKNLNIFYLYAPTARPLLQRLWQSQIVKDMVLIHLWEYLRNPWSIAAMNGRIEALYNLIQVSVYADTCKPYTNSDFEVNLDHDVVLASPPFTSLGLRSFISVRTSAVAAQVNAQIGTRTLLINEVLASNVANNTDPEGDYDDWVELHNSYTSPIYLNTYFLSNDFLDPFKFQLPAVALPAGGYALVWCDSETVDGFWHAPFRLNSDHDAVFLFNGDGSRLLDHVTWDTLATDISYARMPLSYYPWLRTIPTPVASNSDNVPPVIADLRRTPWSPACSSNTIISATITDNDGSIAGAILVYSTDSTFHNLTMFDDGTHGDTVAHDGRFRATIPAQTSRTTVSYYVEATDDDGAIVRYPASAPNALIHYLVDRPQPQISVNEFMAQNNHTIQDEHGDWEDWIEVFNAGSDTLNLSGFSLTDNYSNMRKWVFPDTTLPPAGFLLIWCDEDGGDPGLHASFKLSASGERIALSDLENYGGTILDSLSFSAQTADISLARSCDGTGPWHVEAFPTPEFTNGSCVPRELTIFLSGDSLCLTWGEVPGVQDYAVFRLQYFNEPLAAGTLVGTTTDNFFCMSRETPALPMAFYSVVARW